MFHANKENSGWQEGDFDSLFKLQFKSWNSNSEEINEQPTALNIHDDSNACGWWGRGLIKAPCQKINQ